MVPVARLSRVHTLSSHLPVVFGAVLVYTFTNVFFLKSPVHPNPQVPEHQESKGRAVSQLPLLWVFQAGVFWWCSRYVWLLCGQ